MDPKAMEPQGLALRAYFEGDLDAELIIHRDDGVDDPLRVSHFFRDPSEFTAIETGAIDLCSSHVLDAGAGTGLHSLVLQQKGVAGKVVETHEPNAEYCQWKLQHSRPPGSHYYFVKVTQADGNQLWSAPIWVTVAE